MNKKTSRSMKAVVAIIQRLSAQGTHEPEQMDNVVKALDKLKRGLRVSDPKIIEAAINDISRALLRISFNADK